MGVDNISAPTGESVSVVIYNMLGQKVLSVITENSLNVSALPKSMYIVKITNEDGVLLTTRLQKQ